MLRFLRKLKLKGHIASLICVCTVITTLVTSNNPVQVYADSSSRRRTSINLAQGVGFNNVENLDDIDSLSLQTIAIYLSNFYNPWVTILDGNYENKDLKDTGNKQHVTEMTNALVANCGFKKDVAEWLVGYVLEQSMNSCKPLYIKKKDLNEVFQYSCKDLDNEKDPTDDDLIDREPFIGFQSWDNATNSCIRYGNKEGSSTTIPYNKAYMKAAQSKKGKDGTMYYQVSYPIFLEIMRGYTVYTKRLNLSASVKKQRSTDKLKFYSLDDNSTPHVVFSANDACMSAYALACSNVDYKHGYGSALSSIQDTDIKKIDDPTVTIKALITYSNMYVNWEGSLVLDNGEYRTVILPGCMNPYMLSKIGDKKAGTAVPLQNALAINSINEGNTTKKHGVGVYDGSDESLFRLENWRVTIGSAESKLDDSIKPGNWGKNEKLFDLLDNENNIYVKASWGQDRAKFPNWSEVERTEIKDSQGYCYLKRKASTLSNIAMYDSEQAVTEDSQLTKFFPTDNLFDTVDKLKNYNLNSYASFSNVRKQGHSIVYPASTKELFQSIYVTYCFACFNEDATSFSEDVNIIDLKFNFDRFPKSNTTISWEGISQGQRQQEVLDFAYYFFHPTKGLEYVATLFKNKVSSILIRWHEDVVGSSDSNSSTGMTKYLGTSSYTTTPALKDVSWISSLILGYNSIIVYLIILMFLILLCYVLTGRMRVQNGIIGICMFGLLAFIPPLAIDTTVNTINNTSDTIYTDKFDYWALCQMQTFLSNYQDAMEKQGDKDFSSYAAFVLSEANASNSVGGTPETSYSGVKLKWMSPKKYNSIASLANALKNSTVENTKANYLKGTLLNTISRTTDGQNFLDSDDALFLYRDYVDIYKYAHTSYNVFSTFNLGGKLQCAETPYIQERNTLTILNTNTPKQKFSSVQNAWGSLSILKDHPLQPYVYKNAITKLNSDEVWYETSSAKAISRGFLMNTINYDFEKPSDTAMYYSSYDTHEKNTLAATYLLTYNQTLRQTYDGLNKLKQVSESKKAVDVAKPTSKYYNFGLPKATTKEEGGSYLVGYNELLGYENMDSSSVTTDTAPYYYKDLSDVFYGLYSESPFYYFNNNIRDQITTGITTSDGTAAQYTYDFNNLQGTTSGDKMNQLAKLFLINNQSYFYNLTKNAGDGYGELRDFMNMHDFFYYIIPSLKDGTDLARLYDSLFGLYTDDDCSLTVNADGSCMYDGHSFSTLSELEAIIKDGKYTDEDLYKLWHSYNTYTILTGYTAWLDTMLDCDYAKPETIHIMSDKFLVDNPLDPYSYYKCDKKGKMTEGRYMVFSRSEMKYYGLKESDLTSVERKIIKLQDNVYNGTLKLMNYYTMSEETFIQAYAMLQTFEFNKVFSQKKPIGKDYILYPTGYELKAFSYDAYLRMIVSQASNESLMTSDSNENSSIYMRVMKNTSLFFGIMLLINDLAAVYLLPGLKLFFIITIFFISILLIIASAIKLEMNILKVMWKSLFAPLLAFGAISIGFSLIVSLFMAAGADGVTKSEMIISVGDPTTALMLMLILNIIAIVLYFRICKKCFHDLRVYFKAVFDNLSSTVVGAVGSVVAGITSGKALDKIRNRGKSSDTSSVPSSASQRGRNNNPIKGKKGSDAMLGGAIGGAGGSLMSGALGEKDKKEDPTRGMNKWDKKSFEGASKKAETHEDKADRAKTLAENAHGLRKKRLELAKKYHDKRQSANSQYAENVRKYGKFGAMKKRVGANVTKAKNVAGTQTTRLKNIVGNGVRRASDQSTYTRAAFNAGAKLGETVGFARTAPSRVKKGMASAYSSTSRAVRQAPETIRNGAVSAYNNTTRAVKSGVSRRLNRARSTINAVGNTAYQSKRAFVSGYKHNNKGV